MPTKPPNRYPTLGQTVAESVLLHRPELTEAGVASYPPNAEVELQAD